MKNQELHREIMMREALIYYEANLTQGKMSFGQESFLEQIGATDTEDYNSVLELLTNTVVDPEEREVVEHTFCADWDKYLESFMKQEKAVCRKARLNSL